MKNIKIFLTLTFLLSISNKVGAQQACSMSLSNFEELKHSVRLYSTTGNAELDQITNLDLYCLYDLFAVKANFYIYEDPVQAPNAMAFSGVVSDERFEDGTIIFGRHLFINEFQTSKSARGFAIPGIIAHEMAHILQSKKKSTLSSMQMELQADYFAGYYLSKRSELMLDLHNINVLTIPAEAFESFFKKGDYEYNNPDHHGTKEERLAAIKAGYECREAEIDKVYEESLNYLKLNSSNQKYNKNQISSNKENSIIDFLFNMIKIVQENKLETFQGSYISEHKHSEYSAVSYRSILKMPGTYETRIIYKKYNSGKYLSNFRVRMFDIGSDVLKSSAVNCYMNWQELIKKALNDNGKNDISITKFSERSTNSWKVGQINNEISIELTLITGEDGDNEVYLDIIKES